VPEFWNGIRPNLDTTRSDGNNDMLVYLSTHKLPLRSELGEKWEYADINCDILATIIERVSGKNYEKFLRKHVFRPAGMRHTEGLLATDIRRIKAKNLARGYLRDRMRKFLLCFYLPLISTALFAQVALFEDKEITEKWLIENKIPALGIGVIKEGKMTQINVFAVSAHQVFYFWQLYKAKHVDFLELL
jgi:CubicO group peptidase (beta-lactamase class C family)